MAHGYVAEWADLIGRQEEWYPHYNSQQLAAMGACKACSMRSMQHAACSIHAACGVQGSPRPGGHRVKSHKSRELMGWLTMSWVAGVSNSSKQFHEFHVHVKHIKLPSPPHITWFREGLEGESCQDLFGELGRFRRPVGLKQHLNNKAKLISTLTAHYHYHYHYHWLSCCYIFLPQDELSRSSSSLISCNVARNSGLRSVLASCAS
jgi:hypothetical protein